MNGVTVTYARAFRDGVLTMPFAAGEDSETKLMMPDSVNSEYNNLDVLKTNIYICINKKRLYLPRKADGLYRRS